MNCPLLKQNEGMIDRSIRAILGALALLVGHYWTAGILSVIFFGIGLIATVTAFVGYCGLYSIFHVSTKKKSTTSPAHDRTLAIVLGLFVVVLVVGAIASQFATRKQFLERYNTMNAHYKQTLFLTGQLKRDKAKAEYAQLVSEFSTFESTYTGFRPVALRGDMQFAQDIEAVRVIIDDAKTGVESGDLAKTHTQLEAIRPIFQEMFRRNGFSMLSMALVDFHDSMEKLIAAADAHDSQKLLADYAEADTILRAIELEDSSSDIQTIRLKMTELQTLAERGDSTALPAKAAELKSSFVKVYLIKG